MALTWTIGAFETITSASIITDIRFDIDEESTTGDVSDAQLERLIDRGLVDLASKTRLHYDQATDTVSGTEIDIPSDMGEILDVRIVNGTAEYILNPSTIEEVTEYGIGEYYYLDQGKLVIPDNIDGTIIVSAQRKPLSLADNDDNVDLPEEYTETLKLWVIQKWWFKKRRQEEFAVAVSLLRSGINFIREDINTKQTIGGFGYGKRT